VARPPIGIAPSINYPANDALRINDRFCRHFRVAAIAAEAHLVLGGVQTLPPAVRRAHLTGPRSVQIHAISNIRFPEAEKGFRASARPTPPLGAVLTLEKCLVETPPQRSRRCLRMASVPDVSGPWSRASERRNSRLYLHDEQGEPESTDFGFYFGSIPMAESGCYQERQHPSLFSKGVVRRLCLRLSRLRLRAACRNVRRR
jgi:hypothetical protein